MDKRKILTAINKVNQHKKEGQHLDALIRLYQLNLQMMRFLLESAKPGISTQIKKSKEIINLLSNEIENNNELRAAMSKKNFKSAKLWLKEMDVFYKVIKLEMPKNLNHLHTHGMAVFNLINISANKIFSK